MEKAMSVTIKKAAGQHHWMLKVDGVMRSYGRADSTKKAMDAAFAAARRYEKARGQ